MILGGSPLPALVLGVRIIRIRVVGTDIVDGVGLFRMGQNERPISVCGCPWGKDIFIVVVDVVVVVFVVVVGVFVDVFSLL